MIGTDADATALLALLEPLLRDSALRATDISSAVARLELAGSDVRELIATGCSLDMHPEYFPPGRVARTRFAGMPLVIHCAEADVFQCIVSRSYGDYLRTWLADLGR